MAVVYKSSFLHIFLFEGPCHVDIGGNETVQVCVFYTDF